MPRTTKPPEWEAANAPCPFDNDQFFELWCKLLQMPKWKKKPLSAIQMACNRLKRFDVDFAATLVESAIEGNYQGVVFPDSQRKFELYKQQKNVAARQTGNNSQDLRESVNQEFASRNYGSRGN